MSKLETLRYLFDLQGYLVLEDALTPERVAELNRLIDQQGLPEPGLATEGARFGGSGAGPEGPGLLAWGLPFVELLDDQAVMPVLRMILGDGFRIDHLVGIYMREGTERLGLHGGAVPYDPTGYFHFRDGKMRNGLVVVSWNLVDTGPGRGGFLCIPGSHKSNYAIPDEVMSAHDTSEVVVVPEVPAGSAVVFTEALSHGTAEWTVEEQRRSLLFNYVPSHMAYSRRQASPPTNVELTARQKWLFEPPSMATSFGRPTLFEDSVPEP